MPPKLNQFSDSPKFPNMSEFSCRTHIWGQNAGVDDDALSFLFTEVLKALGVEITLSLVSFDLKCAYNNVGLEMRLVLQQQVLQTIVI